MIICMTEIDCTCQNKTGFPADIILKKFWTFEDSGQIQVLRIWVRLGWNWKKKGKTGFYVHRIWTCGRFWCWLREHGEVKWCCHRCWTEAQVQLMIVKVTPCLRRIKEGNLNLNFPFFALRRDTIMRKQVLFYKLLQGKSCYCSIFSIISTNPI